MKQCIYIGKKHWKEMQDHVERSSPLEACGLLAGKHDQVEKVLLVQNQAKSPVRFVMDPREQLRAFDWIESHELDLLGIFHSHPAGPATASNTDIAEAAYEVVHIIWSRNDEGQWRTRGFWIEKGRATEIELQMIE